jgi:O-antigen ligase
MRAVSYLRLEWLLTQLMTFGIALALFGIIQNAAMPKDDFLVYGFWRPQAAATPFGPFINRNHFAGLMLLLMPLVAGYAGAVATLSRHPADRSPGGWVRWFLSPDAGRFAFASFAVVVMASAVIASGSRSGMASFAVALAVFGLLAARRASRREARLAIWMYIAVLFVGALGWMGMEAVVERFRIAGTDLQDRVAAWRDTLTIIQDFPISGTGFGAYGAAMLLYQTANRTSIFIHAHNEYLQILAEGGLLVAIPAAIAAVVIGRIVRLRLRRGADDALTGWVRLGAVAGLAGIAAQSLFEFSLQMPGNAAMGVLLVAIALHRPRRPAGERDADRV